MADQQAPPGGTDSPRPPGSDAPVGFTLDGAQRVVNVTRYVERIIRQPPAQRSRYPLGLHDGLRIAQTTSTITARSGTTVGTGTAALYHYSGTSLVADSPSTTITVYNPYGSSVASGKWVYVAVVSGQWSLVGADCT